MFHSKIFVLGSLLTAASASAAVIQLDPYTSEQLLTPYTQRCQGDVSCINSRFNEPVNITVTPVELVYGAVEYNGLPVSVDSRVYTVRNCTSTPKTQSTSFTTNRVSGIEIETKDSVSIGQKLTRDINLTFPVKSSKFGSTLKSTYEKTVDFSTAGVNESSSSVTQTVPLTITVPSYTVKIVKYNSIALTGKLPLTARGKINGTTRFGDYASVVPSPFMALTGELRAFEHNEIRHEVYEYPQGNATACRNFQLPAAAQTAHEATADSVVAKGNLQTLSAETAHIKSASPSPLFVRVRLPANASACPVNFNYGRDQIAVLGRAGKWSDWQVLSVADQRLQQLTTAHSCGEQLEVQYSLTAQ